MTEELKELGLDVGHRRVGRLMRENAITVKRNKKFKATTDSNHRFNIAPNLLKRDFSADRPNRKWAGDISYVWTREGWLYLAVILDLHSRRVIGWAVSNRLKRDLAIRALNMAIALRRPPKGCIHHTDRGSQGRFNRSSQHPATGGVDGYRKTEIRTLNAAQIVLAWAATGMAA
ncbi:Integrase, catalytic domain [Stappia aggregata IAM 12614]|uniref:Integrase, catalytic domain n=1 Tax=Roseibium aggregatum (strain ATCC 25650 / DSM 13394 / JCM 20685 / NBRC 16684 / NCIMB 2208 / IAM 12614 / B1) TaxID=384765 RepID=A0P2R0_ROSAI|nr:Integrase, catalytic domain [Stappia aggregata IAM 12614] [Roseibium aggregatum IAM 12614]